MKQLISVLLCGLLGSALIACDSLTDVQGCGEIPSTISKLAYDFLDIQQSVAAIEQDVTSVINDQTLLLAQKSARYKKASNLLGQIEKELGKRIAEFENKESLDKVRIYVLMNIPALAALGFTHVYNLYFPSTFGSDIQLLTYLSGMALGYFTGPMHSSQKS